MKARTRILGVDYGTVRIGLAVSDPERIIASPLATYQRRDGVADERFLRALVEREEIARIVVGLPIHTDGRIGEKAREALAFGAWLKSATGLPVHYYDERFTTHEAESRMRTASLSRNRRKARRDRVAAQILLQSYLEAGCPEDYEPLGLQDP